MEVEFILGDIFRFPTFSPIRRLSRVSAQGFSFPVANPKLTPHFVVKMLQ